MNNMAMNHSCTKVCVDIYMCFYGSLSMKSEASGLQDYREAVTPFCDLKNQSTDFHFGKEDKDH